MGATVSRMGTAIRRHGHRDEQDDRIHQADARANHVDARRQLADDCVHPRDACTHPRDARAILSGHFSARARRRWIGAEGGIGGYRCLSPAERRGEFGGAPIPTEHRSIGGGRSPSQRSPRRSLPPRNSCSQTSCAGRMTGSAHGLHMYGPVDVTSAPVQLLATVLSTNPQ